MKGIGEFIAESLSTSKANKYGTIIKMLEGSKLAKEALSAMLSKLDIDELKELSAYLYEKDMSDFIAYKPNDDAFLKQDNKESICSMLADYLFKNISSK